MIQYDFDVVIIGGGPAGSTAASYLSKRGHSCIVLEKESFPREHIGESLVPSCNRIFNELDLFEELENAGFIRKYGAAWTSTSDQRKNHEHGWDLKSENEVGIAFSERVNEKFTTSFAYHVDRAAFDQLLLEKSERLGATVKMQCKVNSVVFKQNHVHVDYRCLDQTQSLVAKVIVDASGRNTFLGSKLRLKNIDPNFNQFAVYSWFKNFPRELFKHEDYINVHFLPLNHSWIWQIPITKTITSIGVVTEKANIRKDLSSEEMFNQLVGLRPDIAKIVSGSLSTKPYATTGDYSYEMTSFSGHRYVLIGDAARFVDPIFSSGVSIAMNGAREASFAVAEALDSGLFGTNGFEQYDLKMKTACNNWYRFIQLYYSMDTLFTYLIQHPKFRLTTLRLLQGDVFDDLFEEYFLEVDKISRKFDL